MTGKFSLAVRERVGVIRRTYWRTWFKILGGVYSALCVASFLLSEFASASVQRDFLLGVLVPRVPIWSWLAAALVIVSVSGVEGAVRENRRLQIQYDAALATQHFRQDAESAKAMLQIERDRRYEEMCPALEGRIVPWAGRNFGKSHRLEVRIKTRWPLSTIYVEFPSDPRTGLMPFVLEAPKFGDELFRPGIWVTVGDVNYTESPVGDDLAILARCRNEERFRWDDIIVPVIFPSRDSVTISAVKRVSV